MVVVQHAIASSADGSSLLLNSGVSRTGIIQWTLLLGCTLKYRGINVYEIIWKLSKKNLNFRIIRYYIDRKTLLNSIGNVTKGKKKSNKRKRKRKRERRARYIKFPRVREGVSVKTVTLWRLVQRAGHSLQDGRRTSASRVSLATWIWSIPSLSAISDEEEIQWIPYESTVFCSTWKSSVREYLYIYLYFGTIVIVVSLVLRVKTK